MTPSGTHSAPVPPKICAREKCGAEHTRRGKYCSPHCNMLAWQEAKRKSIKVAQREFKRERPKRATPPPLMVAVPFPTTPDRLLYCPNCYGDKPHYLAENGMHRCRACGRERMTPEQARELARLEPVTEGCGH